MKHSSTPALGPGDIIKRSSFPRILGSTVVVLGTVLVTWGMPRLWTHESRRTQIDLNPVRAAGPTTSVQAPPEVNVVRPVVSQSQQFVELEGMLGPQRSTNLAFTVGGTLNKISVRVGDVVTAGARLAQLDTSHALAQFEASSARVRAANALLTLAADHADRETALVASGSLHAASAIDSQLQSTVAEAQLDAARAQQLQARILLSEHTLRAPFAGTVIDAPEAEGSVAIAGVPQFRIANLKTLKLTASVTEADAQLLRVGAKVIIDAQAGPVEGHITRVFETLEAHTRRIPLEAELDAPGALHSGALVRARVVAGEPVATLRLPSGVLRPGTTDEVFVVVPGYSATLALRKLVLFEQRDPGGDLLVQSGIRAEDVVVATPKPAYQPGQVVLVAAGLMFAPESP